MQTVSAITAAQITEAVQTENALLMLTMMVSVITVMLITDVIRLTEAVRAMLMKMGTMSVTTMKTRHPAIPAEITAAAITVPGAGTADKRKTHHAERTGGKQSHRAVFRHRSTALHDTSEK